MDAVSSSQKPIVPTELYRAVRDSQLIGMSGYSREVPTFFVSFFVKINLKFVILWVYVVCGYYGTNYDGNCISSRVFSQHCHLLQGLPVFAVGVGLSTFDKASVSIMIDFFVCNIFIETCSRIWVFMFYHFIFLPWTQVLYHFPFIKKVNLWHFWAFHYHITGPLLCAITYSNKWI